MKTISLNKQCSPIEAMTMAAVKALLQFLTSSKVNITLLAVALTSLMGWLISDGQVGDPASWGIAWVTHFALMSAMDIIRKGGEL